ncbi:hypothetical protein [Mycobacteroides abscessus]|uniref:hypothetical protein n=1 Tax=Mycobacteroides abscessus TaxID=36809 RepID=UPI001F3ABC47|nr:hypothetical protein [Mycobacteroides abscessus]
MVSGRRRTTKRANGKPPFKHRPLIANQVASAFDWISTTRQITVTEDGKTRTYTRAGNDIYALAVLFAAHTEVRASELQGLQIKDITLSDIPGTVGSIRVVRTNQRKDRQRKQGTPKSDASTDRIVPLAPWLADELRDYLTTVHPFAGKYPHAPCSPDDATAMRSTGPSQFTQRTCTSTTYSPPAVPSSSATSDFTIYGIASPP